MQKCKKNIKLHILIYLIFKIDIVDSDNII